MEMKASYVIIIIALTGTVKLLQNTAFYCPPLLRITLITVMTLL